MLFCEKTAFGEDFLKCNCYSCRTTLCWSFSRGTEQMHSLLSAICDGTNKVSNIQQYIGWQVLNHLPQESAQKQCTHFYFRFWTEGKTDLWTPGGKTVFEWRPASGFKNVKHLCGYGKEAACVTQAKIALRRGANPRFMGQAEPRLGRAFNLKQGSAWRMLRHAPNCGPILLLPHRPGRAEKGDTQPGHGVRGSKWQVQGNDRRERVTFNHINGCRFQKLSLLQAFTLLMKCHANSVKS